MALALAACGGGGGGGSTSLPSVNPTPAQCCTGDSIGVAVVITLCVVNCPIPPIALDDGHGYSISGTLPGPIWASNPEPSITVLESSGGPDTIITFTIDADTNITWTNNGAFTLNFTFPAQAHPPKSVGGIGGTITSATTTSATVQTTLPPLDPDPADYTVTLQE